MPTSTWFIVGGSYYYIVKHKAITTASSRILILKSDLACFAGEFLTEECMTACHNEVTQQIGTLYLLYIREGRNQPWEVLLIKIPRDARSSRRSLHVSGRGGQGLETSREKVDH